MNGKLFSERDTRLMISNLSQTSHEISTILWVWMISMEMWHCLSYRRLNKLSCGKIDDEKLKKRDWKREIEEAKSLQKLLVHSRTHQQLAGKSSRRVCECSSRLAHSRGKNEERRFSFNEWNPFFRERIVERESSRGKLSGESFHFRENNLFHVSKMLSMTKK